MAKAPRARGTEKLNQLQWKTWGQIQECILGVAFFSLLNCIHFIFPC